MMKKSFIIARWEYLEKVKTRTFIVSLIITPLLIIAVAILPSLLIREETPTIEAIGVIDTTGIYFSYLLEEFDKYELPDGQKNYILINLTQRNTDLKELISQADKNVLKNILRGYLLIYRTDGDSILTEYRSSILGNFKVMARFEEALNSIRIRQMLESEGIRRNLIQKIHERTIVRQKKIEEEGKVSDVNFVTTFFMSVVFILLLMMTVIYSGQMLVRSMIEEKSSRLIEMIVSSSTPDEILTGKILGLSLLGLTQIAIWVIIGLSLIVSTSLPIAAFSNIVPMLIYFILGFLFYTSLFVGIGSTVSTEQEAQQVTTYISLILMLPVVIALPAIQNPDFMLTKIFSYFPLTIPTVMLLRLNVQNVPGIEILLTMTILILSIFIVTKISARMFKIGISSYGSSPTLKEIFNQLKS
jgi:ABC-2 type transport system permease protein